MNTINIQLQNFTFLCFCLLAFAGIFMSVLLSKSSWDNSNLNIYIHQNLLM